MCDIVGGPGARPPVKSVQTVAPNLAAELLLTLVVRLTPRKQMGNGEGVPSEGSQDWVLLAQG